MSLRNRGEQQGTPELTVLPDEGTARPTTAEIIAEAFPPDTSVESFARERTRFQTALIARIAGEGAGREDQLRAAFSLYADDLMSRGEIRERFGLSIWEFLDYQSRFLSFDPSDIKFS